MCKLCKMIKKWTLPSLPPSRIWYDINLKIFLPAAPSLPFVDSRDTNSRCLFFFSIDLWWTILHLMTGWLPIRKHFITAWYSRQVKQCCEDSICLAHMDIRDLIMLKSKQPVPWVSALFKCMLSFVCERKLAMVHAQTEFSQCLANVLCWWRTCPILAPIFIWNLYNECLCFEDGIQSTHSTYTKCLIFTFWLLQAQFVQMQTPWCCIKIKNGNTLYEDHICNKL